MAIIDLPDDENQSSIVIMQQVQSDFECMNVVDDLPVESHHQLQGATVWSRLYIGESHISYIVIVITYKL